MTPSVITKTLLILFCAASIRAQGDSPWEVHAQPTAYNLNRMSFLNPDTGWVVGDSGLVLYTSDGGSNWVFQDSKINSNIVDVQFLSPAIGWALAPQRAFTTEDPFGTYFLRTGDGGASWDSTWFNEQIIWGLVLTSDTSGWIGGENGVLLGSKDGGLSWEEAVFASGTESGFTLENLEMYSQNLLIGTGGRFDLAGTIWESTNGGRLWRAYNPGPEPIYDVDFFSSTDYICVGGDFDFGAGVLRTQDAGANWDYQFTGFWGQGRRIDFRTGQEAWVPLGFSGTIMKTLDQGATWELDQLPGNIPMYDIVFFDSLTGYMVGDQGTMLRYNPQPVGIAGSNAVAPADFALYANYPNPFNPATTIPFSLAGPAQVAVQIFDISGRLLHTLTDTVYPAGNHRLVWRGDNQSGEAVSSGVYLYRLKSGPHTAVRKLVLLR